MRIEDFDFELPDEAIARHPAEKRDASRLMVLDRASGTIAHHVFSDLPALLSAGDLLVVNDTRVLPARLMARKTATGGRVEILLIEPIAESATSWRAMVAASKGVRAGAQLDLADGSVATVTAEEGEGFVVLELPRPAVELARSLGEIPLPPYLGRRAEESDRTRYQTVYAQGEERSVAAPTAGLHFTEELFTVLRARGIERAQITLHVGPGTFLPVRVDDVEKHRMYPERYQVSAETARKINSTRGRVVAVGTTVTRTLETLGRPIPPEGKSGATDLFLRPGHQFRGVDAMVTNFHLPRSTLLMLVSAFAGRDKILAAYREAISRGYQFFSYGDAMLIL